MKATTQVKEGGLWKNDVQVFVFNFYSNCEKRKGGDKTIGYEMNFFSSSCRREKGVDSFGIIKVKK